MLRLFFLSILLTIGSASSFAQQKSFLDRPFIETSAKVDTLVVPDRIYMMIILSEKDTKGKTSVEELESKMVSSLQSLNIETDEFLSLNDLSSNFKKYLLKDQDVLKVKSYSLVVKDAVKAGEVILALEELNISNISIDKTEYSKIDQLHLALRTKAVLKAKAQAESLTAPLGQQVGSALYISDQYEQYDFSDQLYGQAAGIQIRGYSSGTTNYKILPTIEFQKIKVESQVTIKFELK